jgi:serine/threonine-protein kinase
MTIQPGTRLGQYVVQSAIGAGGMGEVFKARDQTLNRDVALKVLPDLFAADPERLARFQREARLLAALNHPHIAAIYGVEQADSHHFLVLELVEGQTLAERLTQAAVDGKPRGLGVKESLRIARQVIDALEAAHDKGIIHRDLKPSNIALTPDGDVKVLDFGLAKHDAVAATSSTDALGATYSPTLTLAHTQAGVILGTAAYMSPEQAKGRVADKRSDVWSFGCVLYEMLTGRRAFEGEDVSDTLAAILRGEPDWNALPKDLPPSIATLIKRCVDRDRRSRIPDVSVARFLLDDTASAGLLAAPPTPQAAPAPVPSRSTWLPWIVSAALGLALIAALVLWAPWRAEPPRRASRLNTSVGADVSLLNTQGANAVVSSDGSVLAFVAAKSATEPAQIFVRRLEQLQATALAGTEGATNPFFAPDGQSIAFFAGGKLKKVSINGGAAVTLCDAPSSRGGWWGDRGTIAFEPVSTAAANLQRVSSAGGTPAPLVQLEKGEVSQRWPQLLSGERAVLFSTTSSITAGFEGGSIVVQPLPEGPRKTILRDAYYGRYLSSGHLVYMHQGTLFAAPFDVDRLELTGPPVPVVESIATTPQNGGAQYAFSDTGTLIYIAGESVTTSAPIQWLEGTGKLTPLRAMPADWSNPSFSPDGRLLAVDIFDGTQTDVWTYDWMRDTLSRLTFDNTDDGRPVWSPDSHRIAFASKRGDKMTTNLYWQRADGTGDVQRLTDSKMNQSPGTFHPSGKFLAYEEFSPAGDGDILILPIEGDEASGFKAGKPTIFLKTPFNEGSPMFSPDGRWIAYISNDTGRNEIYVRPFPGPGGKWQISTGSGDDPTWSRVRPELFFASADTLRLMVSPYTVAGDSFRADKPRLWSETNFTGRPRAPSRDLDLHPDGLRFAIAAGSRPETGGGKLDHVVMVTNFFDELRRVAPPKQ